MKTKVIRVSTGTNELGRVLNKACGPRSLTEFARACGISVAQMSRVKSGKVQPSKRLLFKIASERFTRESGVTYEDLLKAAGYSGYQVADSVEFTLRSGYGEHLGLVGLLTSVFTEHGWKCQLLPAQGDFECDFAFQLTCADGTGEVWEFYSSESQKILCFAERTQFFYLYGRMVDFSFEVGKQYVIIAPDRYVFEMIEQTVNPDLISAPVMVLLIDRSRMEIEKEVRFGPDGRLTI